MENHERTSFTKGLRSLADLGEWIRNVVVKHMNKQWVVLVPPNKGKATIRDSDKKVTIDLTQVTFGGGVTPEDTFFGWVVVQSEDDPPLYTTEVREIYYKLPE